MEGVAQLVARQADEECLSKKREHCQHKPGANPSGIVADEKEIIACKIKHGVAVMGLPL
jgi:hypothetical protein